VQINGEGNKHASQGEETTRENSANLGKAGAESNSHAAPGHARCVHASHAALTTSQVWRLCWLPGRPAGWVVSEQPGQHATQPRARAGLGALPSAGPHPSNAQQSAGPCLSWWVQVGPRKRWLAA